MKVIHRGFDTIHLAIQANIPSDLFDYLTAEKERADDARSTVEVSYNGAEFHLSQHGGNGYRFILDDGPLGARWAFKKPNAKDPWGVRIMVGSTFLATQGLGAVRGYIADTMDALGMPFANHHVSLARADFCVDILAPDFKLDPEQFVMHSNANRADYLTEETDRRSNGRSARYTSVTIGKMPGRQVIVYDKRAEVIGGYKPIWWDIWNSNLARDGLPPLDRTDASTSRVWRVEVRAGKNLLKDRWQIRTWSAFDARFGDLVAETLDKIRYTEPDPTDSNRARWSNAPIWKIAQAAIEDDLMELRSYINAPTVKDIYREEHIRLLEAQITGGAITLAALRGTAPDALADAMIATGQGMHARVTADAEHAEKKLREASGRYRFVQA